jgi:hypothetical protein
LSAFAEEVPVSSETIRRSIEAQQGI